jgi:hypothetical protein
MILLVLKAATSARKIFTPFARREIPLLVQTFVAAIVDGDQLKEKFVEHMLVT